MNVQTYTVHIAFSNILLCTSIILVIHTKHKTQTNKSQGFNPWLLLLLYKIVSKYAIIGKVTILINVVITTAPDAYSSLCP